MCVNGEDKDSMARAKEGHFTTVYRGLFCLPEAARAPMAIHKPFVLADAAGTDTSLVPRHSPTGAASSKGAAGVSRTQYLDIK